MKDIKAYDLTCYLWDLSWRYKAQGDQESWNCVLDECNEIHKKLYDLDLVPIEATITMGEL